MKVSRFHFHYLSIFDKVFGFQPNKKDLSFYVLLNASKVENIFFGSFKTLIIKYS